MACDERIVVFGEDVHHLNGGTNGATKGLAKYGASRLVGTPISENAFTGIGGGLALDGRFRPVVEFMYPDFMWVAADQVFNQIGKARHMFGGDNPVPFVLRTKVAMGSGYGSQHLMDPAGIFATSPGWRIVAPSTAADYVGLMNAALALQDPVLVIEHVDLYGTADKVPEGDLDYVIPPGRAAIRRAGADVTVISYLSMVAHCARGDRADRYRRRTDRPALARPRVDRLGHHHRQRPKTNAVLIVEQGARGSSYGGWLADEIQRRLFDWLDQPVERVSGEEASPEHLARCSNAPRSPAPRKSSPASRRSASEWGSADAHRGADAGGVSPTPARRSSRPGWSRWASRSLSGIHSPRSRPRRLCRIRRRGGRDPGPADRRTGIDDRGGRAHRGGAGAGRNRSRHRSCSAASVRPPRPYRSPNSSPRLSPHLPPRPTGGDSSPHRWCESSRASEESSWRA